MRKYLLLCTALTISSSAYAALDCATPPTCEEWGFTMTTSDCAGKFVLRCPREPNNDNAVFCGGIGPVECAKGSILYSDLKCYDEVPDSKTAIAVVFDTTNRLAVSLEEAGTLGWSSSTTDISAVPNFMMDAEASVGASAHTYYTTSETSGGISDTAAIVQFGGGVTPAASKCYNSTYGGQDTWFLPTLGDVINISYVKSALGGIWIDGATYWSSTEVGAEAWAFSEDGGPMAKNKASAPYYVLCTIRY